MPSSEEYWDSYYCRIGGVPTSVSLNLALLDDSPDPQRPTLMRVQIGALAHRDNGMPSSEEFDTLAALEDQIIELITPRSCIHLGALTSPAGRQVAFYAPADSELTAESFNFIPPSRRPADFFQAEPDEQWSFYRDFMYPNPSTLRMMHDNIVLRRLDELGDIREAERRIDHWIYFDSATAANEFADWARQNGYNAELLEVTDDRPTPGVQLHHTSNLLPDTIYPITDSLRIQAETMHGEYDGWETFIVRQPPAEPPTR
jgi:hypothetical protein